MKTDKPVETGITGLDIRITVSVAVCCIVSTILSRSGVKFVYEGMEMEILQKMTGCISCLLCCQDSVEFSVKAGVNRMIITFIGGAAAVAVALIDQQISSEWLFDLLVIIGVPAVIWLCRAARVPYINARIGGVTFILVSCMFSGNRRIWYAVFRMISTCFGAFVVFLVSWVMIGKNGKTDKR